VPHDPSLVLELIPGRFAVARLEPQAEVPGWASRRRRLSAVVRTLDELSVLTEEDDVPADVRAERGYRALRVRGPLPFHLVGILASIAAPLAAARVSIFSVSSYDTDYVLVKQDDLPSARAALTGAGHTVVDTE
jgi:uncharacterized protein